MEPLVMAGLRRVRGCAIFCVLVLGAGFARGQAYQVTDMCDFPGAAATRPLQGADGNFYELIIGMVTGIPYLARVTPFGVETAVYTFPEAEDPNSLLLGTDGNFYGTTLGGGASGAGSIFEITPDGKYTLLHSFSGPGEANAAAIIEAQDGKLYGTTSSGEHPYLFTFYSFDLSSKAFTVLYSYKTASSPDLAMGPLVQGSDGKFYGVFITNANGGGVFSLTTGGAFKQLFSLGSEYEFGTWSPLVEGPDGYFYGWVSTYVRDGLTAIYKINPKGEAGLVYEFPAGAIPMNTPAGALTVGSDGKLYGAYYPANPTGQNDPADFFSLTTGGDFKIVSQFITNDWASNSSFTQGADGAFYGLFDVAGGSSLYRFGNRLLAAPNLAGPVSIGLTPAVIAPGESATLQWSVSNAYGESANLCFGSGDWSGIQPASGTKTITAGKGDYTYGLTCGGIESSSAGLTVGADRAASTETLLVNPPVVTVGNGLTVVATVNSVSGSGPTPTGVVTVSSKGTTFFSYPLSNSAADVTFSTVSLPPGPLTISSVYDGDANYLPSSAATASVQLQGTPVMTVTANPNPATLNQPVTLEISVLPLNGGPTPTGTVAVLLNETSLGNYTLSGGTVSITMGAKTTGSQLVGATYNGDANYLTASAVGTYNVKQYSTVVLAVSPNPVTEGQPATLTAHVKDTASDGGTMTFTIPGVVIGTAEVQYGSATLTASSAGVPPGTYSVTAKYSGDAVNYPVNSPPVTVTVTK